MMRTTGSGQSLESQCNRHVRFTPKSGHVQCNHACPLSANSGHGHPLVTLFFISRSSEEVRRGLSGSFASAGVLMQINEAQ